jgi:hypothetical protein
VPEVSDIQWFFAYRLSTRCRWDERCNKDATSHARIGNPDRARHRSVRGSNSSNYQELRIAHAGANLHLVVAEPTNPGFQRVPSIDTPKGRLI